MGNPEREFAELIENWARSEDGRREIETTRRRVEETKRRLAEERAIDPRMFRMPLTV